jgi:RND superfamily putative drug exporter
MADDSAPPASGVGREERGPQTVGGRRLRRAKWPVLVVWILLLLIFGSLGMKLSGIEKNDAAAYLPSKSESAKVQAELESRPGGKSIPGAMVYHRSGGLTAQDKAAVAAARQRLVDNPVAEAPILPVVVDSSGETQLVLVNVPASDDSKVVADNLDAARAVLLKDLPPGLDTYFSGPAGLARDQLKVFGSIDGILLLASGLVVAIILLITYRSPVLFFLPLLGAIFAIALAQGVVYLLAKSGLTVNGQSAGILTVLVFGAGTDYALLLVSRYREELHNEADKHDAMLVALRQALPAIIASGSTVIIGLLCLLVSELESDKGLGPVGAAGVACALLAMCTLLPTLLLVCGRWLFWPFVPRAGEPSHVEDGLWGRIAARVDRHHRLMWIGTSLLLVALAFGMLTLNTGGLKGSQLFRTNPESKQGQAILDRSFPAGTSAPVQVLANAAALDQVKAVLAAHPLVVPGSVRQVREAYNGRVEVDATLQQADGTPAFKAVDAIRAKVRAIPGAGARVGGQTAITLDVNRASVHDRKLVIPIVLLVVFLILGLLLRAIVAPLVLMLTVVLSFLSALGASALLFAGPFGFPATDPSFPLFAFIFLVALGIDYNIFLMSRVREEALEVGTRQGMIRGLRTTGGVITSAGVVLAGTFAVLATLPIVTLAEVGVVVAIGVLLDTFIVRSLLVPALTIDIGREVWWPSKLAKVRDEDVADEKPDEELVLR